MTSVTELRYSRARRVMLFVNAELDAQLTHG